MLPGGLSYILELPPGLEGKRTAAVVGAPLKTYCKLGGSCIAFNALDEKVLRFGYSHRFVELSPELQEYVIQRCRAIGLR